MQVNWRYITASRNSFAALYAACEKNGIILEPVDEPEADVTLYSLNSINAPQYIDEIKNADCITVVGGPHPSALYNEVLEYADYAIVGEGEFTLPRLLKAIEKQSIERKSRGLSPFEKTDGKAVILDPENTPKGVATRYGYKECDTCVYLNAFEPFTKFKGYMELSRGCPFRCAYCQTPRLFGGRMRHRSIDSLVRASKAYNDLRFLTPNALSYGSNGVTPAYDKLEKLLTAFDSSKNLYLGTFPSECRPEFITQEAVDLIKTYCSNTKIHFGAQSGSDNVLKRIHRGHTTGDVINAAELCRDNGMTPVVDYILGLPGETADEQMQTVEQIKWLSRFGKVHAHYFLPLAGTELYRTKPAELIPEVRKTLGKLALSGRVTGAWVDAELRFLRNKHNQIDNDENSASH